MTLLTKPSLGPDHSDAPPAWLPLWRLYFLRFGYLVIGFGLALTQWAGVVRDHDSWPLMEGVVDCLLVAMSLLAFLGVRYPVQMLPLLLFESLWKLIWLGVVALPQWINHQMDAATRDIANACLWVVIVLAVIPWGMFSPNTCSSAAIGGADGLADSHW
jgi:hypothetical protein